MSASEVYNAMTKNLKSGMHMADMLVPLDAVVQQRWVWCDRWRWWSLHVHRQWEYDTVQHKCQVHHTGIICCINFKLAVLSISTSYELICDGNVLCSGQPYDSRPSLQRHPELRFVWRQWDVHHSEGMQLVGTTYHNIFKLHNCKINYLGYWRDLAGS